MSGPASAFPKLIEPIPATTWKDGKVSRESRLKLILSKLDAEGDLEGY